MMADYKNAAKKAIEAVSRFGINPDHVDPLIAFNKLHNVLLIPYAENSNINSPLGDNQDSFTLVNKVDGKLQYIVIYNKGISDFQLRFALARELGHIILEHDGTSPESKWYEEATCFAYHFLCPVPLMKSFQTKEVTINYRPKRHCLSWELKDAIQFSSIDAMKYYLINERNKISRYVGGRVTDYKLDDIALLERCDYEQVTGWHNCYDVALNGEIIGHCGE